MANKRMDEDPRARESFTAEDKRIAADDPTYGDALARYKTQYLNASTDEERADAKGMADALSRSYGYDRNADGSALTKRSEMGASGVSREVDRSTLSPTVQALLAKDDARRASRTQSNLQTIANFDKAYGKGDANGYQGVINALLADIAGAKFTYSAKDDPRYALAEEYASKAMKNQMAESAALTGGYGNSYSAAAGQQVYDDYMEGAVDNLEDRAYSRFQDEQNDRYQRLNTLIGLEGTAYDRALERENTEYNRALERENAEYSRAETAKATAQARLRTFFEEGGSIENLPEDVKTASGYTDAEIAAIYRSAQESRSKDTSADARDRVDAFIANGGDPAKLPPELLAASGYTDAEIAAAREYVLENIRRQNASTYSGSKSGSGKAASGNADTDGQAEETGDAEGLFLAAYAASERVESDMTPEEYIAKNYKAFGFDSASGLVKQYRETMSPSGVPDISQEDANAYLKENGIDAGGVVDKTQFYAQDCRVGGKQYDSYADYIDDLVDSKLQLAAKRAGFTNNFGGYLENQARKARE